MLFLRTAKNIQEFLCVMVEMIDIRAMAYSYPSVNSRSPPYNDRTGQSAIGRLTG
jgi:hypothetical protein